ncbi:MAG: 5-oxoprolinase subunit B family protein [Gemmataceae bacterium]
MKLSPLGDQAILARFDDEATAAYWATSLRAAAPPWLLDVVPAYATVGVFFDGTQIRFFEVQGWLENCSGQPAEGPSEESTNDELITVPCCYELSPDLDFVANHLGLTTAKVIEFHSGTEYRVYAVGFCPGFPYLGYLPDQLSGVPRLGTPRLRVEAGSVGLTGRQTGICTMPRPGGWPIIGRTPLTLVDLEMNFFSFSVGNRVRFSSISASELNDRFRESTAPK